MMLAARFQRHYSDRQIWIVCQVVMAVGLILPILYASLGVLVLGGVCVGGTFMVITMVGMREAHRVSRSGNPQRLIAALTAAFALGQIIGPALAGWSYEATGSFSAPLLLGSVLLVVTLVPLAKS